MKKLNLTAFVAVIAMIVLSIGFFGFKPVNVNSKSLKPVTNIFKIKKITKLKGTYYFVFYDQFGAEVEVTGAVGSNTINLMYGYFFNGAITGGTATGSYNVIYNTLNITYTCVNGSQYYDGSYSAEQTNPIYLGNY